MFAYLEGKFVEKNPTSVIVDVAGVGYDVNITLNTYTAIEANKEGKLFTFLQIKEDAHTLFGFFDKAEKDMFLLLLSVSGVGAATARMMLSSLQPKDVTHAIQMGNVKMLESIKGIGKKTAERLVLELKDKVSKVAVGASNSTTVSNNWGNNKLNDALNALMALGINRAQAENAVNKIEIDEKETLETIIKKALKAI